MLKGTLSHESSAPVPCGARPGIVAQVCFIGEVCTW